MGSNDLPSNYLVFNSAQSKNPVIVVDIAGAPDILTNSGISTEILYGDPLIHYGDPGLTYGGFRPFSALNADGSLRLAKDYLSLDRSSLTISQRLEIEQGKASVSTLTLGFIDYQGYMTNLISPGQVLPEILGAEVNIYLGYKETSYPQDYFRIFRGFVSAVQDGPGFVTLQLSDPNIKRRQQLFFIGTTTLSGDINNSVTTIPVISTNNFFSQITAPDGTFPNPSVHIYILIDSEWMEVSASTSTTFTVTRGSRGTTADVHSSGASVAAGLQLGDSTFTENSIDMALKIMLSGWDGPWITGEPILSIGPTPDPNPADTSTSVIYLPQGVSATENYGLVAQDWVILQGSSHGGNNNTLFQIVRFDSVNGGSNNSIVLSATLTKELASPATIGFRSQYDVYPTEAGLMLTPQDVDIAQHIYIRDTFLGVAGNDYIFFITSAETSGKDFLELQIYFPVGAYSLTRRGKISCGYHSPPLASQGMSILNEDNIINPDKGLMISRATNNRAFFDEIDITYDYDDSGTPHTTTKFLGDGFSFIGVTSVLPIDALGVYSGFSSALLLQRATFLLNRYNRGAVIIDLSVNWQMISTIEAGDVVTIDDSNGVLQIANFSTGMRNLTGQLFEVIDRTFDIRNGNGTLKLLGGLGATVTDRYASVSPSSRVGSGSTNTSVIITDSFGAIFPGDESKKWVQFLGQSIRIHSVDYSVDTTVTLISIDSSNSYILNTSAIGFTPTSGYIVDVPPYPSSADPTINALYKLFFAFMDPTVAVVTGVSNTQFTVSGGDIGKFHVDCPIRVHTVNYSSDSGDLTVLTIVGTTITTSASMGFTPNNTMKIDLIGFADFNSTNNTGQAYRLL